MQYYNTQESDYEDDVPRPDEQEEQEDSDEQEVPTSLAAFMSLKRTKTLQRIVRFLTPFTGCLR